MTIKHIRINIFEDFLVRSVKQNMLLRELLSTGGGFRELSGNLYFYGAIIQYVWKNTILKDFTFAPSMQRRMRKELQSTRN